MTPQELFDTLIKELSASGSELITDNDGTKLTLRQAVNRIFWKENFLLPLTDRPEDPKHTDDQLGHVLSARVEGLQNQALLTALCEAFRIDVNEILTQVKDSL